MGGAGAGVEEAHSRHWQGWMRTPVVREEVQTGVLRKRKEEKHTDEMNVFIKKPQRDPGKSKTRISIRVTTG